MEYFSLGFSCFVLGFTLAQLIYTNMIEKVRERQEWYRERWIEERDS